MQCLSILLSGKEINTELFQELVFQLKIILKLVEIGIVLWFTAYSMLHKFGKIAMKQLTSDHQHIATKVADIPNKCMERNQQAFIT